MVPKRAFWLVTGVAIGAGSSLWAERKVRRTLQEAAARLQPDALMVEVGRSARQAAGSAGGRVRDAVASGKGEMLRREEELWAELAASGVAVETATVAVTPPSTPPVDATETGPVRRNRVGRRRRPPANSASYLDK